MLIVEKGGIRRTIDEERLHEYQERGYKAVTNDDKPKRRDRKAANAGVSADGK